MKVLIFDNSELLFEALTNKYISLLKEQPEINLGLATGSTPVPLYENLIKAYKNNEISFKKVSTFNLDEYIGLPNGHKESYRVLMNETFFNYLDINLDNTHFPKGDAKDIYEEIKRYDKLLDKNIIDLQLVGIGTNAHIGFNEPGTSFDSLTNIVELSMETRLANKRFFNSLDEVPTKAMTMGIKTILNSKEVILVATGKNKAEAIYKTLEEEISEQVPASSLRLHNKSTVYLDKEAASLLKNKY